MDYIKEKNRMLLHLSEKSNRNYVKKVYKEIVDKKNPKEFSTFIKLVRTYDRDQKIRELNLEDAVFVGLERLKAFSKYRLRGAKGRDKSEMTFWFNYNLESANFVGQFALDGHYKNDYIAWDYCKDTKYLKAKNLLPKDASDGTYMMLLVFPVKKDYPYTMIEKIGEENMFVDNLEPRKYLSNKTMDSLREAQFVHFLDQGQFVAMFNESDYPTWQTDRIKLDTPQQRFKFVRKYLCGFSQNDFAKKLMEISFQTADQKKIDYWENSDNPFPPFVRGDQLKFCAEIFARKSRHILGLELRDNIGEDTVSIQMIAQWYQDFISTNPNDQLFNAYPDFIWRIMDYQSDIKPKGSKLNAYKDAVKRYHIQDRIDQEQVMDRDQISAQILHLWFTYLEDMSESEIVGSLELVYDNDEDRSDVYDIWKTLRIKFPKVRKEFQRTPIEEQSGQQKLKDAPF
jgi:hypothetical protein